jgi:dihydroorotase
MVTVRRGDAFAAAARFVEAGTLDCTTTTEYGEVIKGSIPKPTSDTVGLFYMQNSEIHSNIDASKEKGLIGAMKAFAAHAVANTLAGTKNGAVSVRVTDVELKD